MSMEEFMMELAEAGEEAEKRNRELEEKRKKNGKRKRV